MNSILLGTIKVYSSGRHTIRFDMVEKYSDKNYHFEYDSVYTGYGKSSMADA